MTENGLKIKPQKERVKDTRDPMKIVLARSQERDPYYTHGKMERYDKRIRESEGIRPRNKVLFFDFVRWLKSDATAIRSESRVLKYYRHFWQILPLCRLDMDTMTRH